VQERAVSTPIAPSPAASDPLMHDPHRASPSPRYGRRRDSRPAASGPALAAGERHAVAGAAGRLAATVGGAALLACAAQRRRGWLGLGMALTGAPLVYRGLTGHWPISRSLAERATAPIVIEASVTINRSPADLYAFWRRLENLPRFMHGLDSVTEDGNRSHWVGHTAMGLHREWDAEIVEDRPGTLLSWRSLPGAQVHNAGSVLFEDATGHRGTVVRVTMELSPPGDGLRRAVGKALTPGTAQQVREELRRFKCLMEAGEVPTTESQPAGERSAIDRHNPLSQL
jgi:uncharacterized membrane protein